MFSPMRRSILYLALVRLLIFRDSQSLKKKGSVIMKRCLLARVRRVTGDPAR
jgi:hypothetical protein